MTEKRFLSLNAMDKILRITGLRVSDKAKEALADALERNGTDLAHKARTFAEHAGRRTITARDVHLAVTS